MSYSFLQQCFDVLEVSDNATLDEIRDAYKRMVRRYHPDKNKDADATERFQAVKEAYDGLVLYCKIQQLTKYSADLKCQVQVPTMFFEVERTLEEIFRGGIKRVKITRTETFAAQNRAARKTSIVLPFIIPLGVHSGDQFEGKQLGDRKPGLIPADVIVTVVEKPHPLFKRAPNKIDLIYEHKISFIDTITLSVVKFSIRGVDKKKLKVRIPNLITSDYEHRVAGAGLPIEHSDGKRRGDLLIRFKILYPSKLTVANRIALAKVWLKN